jgi:disulfide bond formation protein DsbB
MKQQLIFFVNKFFAIGVLVGIGLLLLFLILLFSKKRFLPKGRRLFVFPLLVSFLATGGSLFYSEIAGFAPCKLCWWQRIFMYPQLPLFFTAFFLNNRSVFYYSLVLSLIGGMISLYHYLLQFGYLRGGDCLAVGYSVSCVKRFVAEFGFVTIPLMALTAFLLLFFWAVLVIRNKTNKSDKNNRMKE